jgi:ribosomal protein L11 methyltransferase
LQKYYYELKIKPNLHYNLFLDLLLELTDEAIEELDGTLILRSAQSLENIENGIEEFSKELSRTLNQDIKCELDYSKKENLDWILEYKDSITPVEAGQFYIHPSWHEGISDKINIIIDPALAFGSGHHETTSSCLDLISKYANENQTLLDVGCGSGILGIAASKLNMKVDICDTDLVSIENSIDNFKLNNVKLNDNWVGSAIKANNRYDIVVANIVADVLVMISSDLKSNMNNDGLLILSGILAKYEEKVLKKFKEFKIIETIKKGDWVTITLKKVNMNEK